jgi:hypothetical protein
MFTISLNHIPYKITPMIHHLYQHWLPILFFLTFFAAIVVSIWAVNVWNMMKDYRDTIKRFLN